jgi:hypothetical protein
MAHALGREPTAGAIGARTVAAQRAPHSSQPGSQCGFGRGVGSRKSPAKGSARSAPSPPKLRLVADGCHACGRILELRGRVLADSRLCEARRVREERLGQVDLVVPLQVLSAQAAPQRHPQRRAVGHAGPRHELWRELGRGAVPLLEQVSNFGADSRLAWPSSSRPPKLDPARGHGSAHTRGGRLSRGGGAEAVGLVQRRHAPHSSALAGCSLLRLASLPLYRSPRSMLKGLSSHQPGSTRGLGGTLTRCDPPSFTAIASLATRVRARLPLRNQHPMSLPHRTHCVISSPPARHEP